ncbi:MAG: hypothetical protein ACKVQW_14725 [Pyrinomonadaceae bacterium]
MSDTNTDVKGTGTKSPKVANAVPAIVLDFGTKSRKKVKRLRKGRGSLMARLNESIEDLKSDETISPSSQVVVVLVKQRNKRRGLFG